MRTLIKPALLLLLALSLLTGLAYPLLVTAIAQIFFPRQANGSLIQSDGKLVGSALIGQPFEDPKYFWSRPSATGPFQFNAAASSGSNYGPLNETLLQAVAGRIQALRQADSTNTQPIPVDLVTASGSGLDPHISPAAAFYQVSRIARVRGIDEASIRHLIEKHLEGRQLGFLGEPRVNVLKLNLALDDLPNNP
ncbi:MAG: potassium-transporting ATPase subunit KdpC [bacterium]